MIRSPSFSNKALCINEYEGLVFNCEGAGNTACLKTGEQVIESLTFENHTVSYPVFGMGMLIIGFVFVAFFILNSSQLKFIDLGHVGSAYASTTSASTVLANEILDENATDSNQRNEDIAKAPKQWDVENTASSDFKSIS